LLKIGSVPLGTHSLALVLDDVNAPSGHFVHWVVWDIAPQTKEISEGKIPSGAMEGTTSAKKAGYAPPCPQPGSGPHRYVFSLYAINDGISLSYEGTRAMLEQQMKGKVLSIAKWTGVYERMEN
jgi:Raf kinase inhibitor-like YbhB/YbcL family protein